MQARQPAQSKQLIHAYRAILSTMATNPPKTQEEFFALAFYAIDELKNLDGIGEKLLLQAYRYNPHSKSAVNYVVDFYLNQQALDTAAFYLTAAKSFETEPDIAFKWFLLKLAKKNYANTETALSEIDPILANLKTAPNLDPRLMGKALLTKAQLLYECDNSSGVIDALNEALHYEYRTREVFLLAFSIYIEHKDYQAAADLIADDAKEPFVGLNSQEVAFNLNYLISKMLEDGVPAPHSQRFFSGTNQQNPITTENSNTNRPQ